MDAGTVIALIVALGGGATIKSLFDLVTGRGRRKIDETASLTEVSERVVRMVQAQADRSAAEAKEVQDQLRATRAELRSARDEIHVLQIKFDQMINAEKLWAERHGHDDAPIFRIVQ